MGPRRSRSAVFLLVALLVTWGTCPCVFARMLDLGCSEQPAPAPHAAAPGPC